MENAAVESEESNCDSNIDNVLRNSPQKKIKVIRILEMVVDGMYSFGHTVFPESFFNSDGLTIINGFDFKTKSHNQTGKSKVASSVYWIIVGEDLYKKEFGIEADDVINYNLDRGCYGHIVAIDQNGQRVVIQRYRNYKPWEGGPKIYTSEGKETTARSTGVTIRINDEFLHKDAVGPAGVEAGIKKCFGYSKNLLKLAMVTPQKGNPAQILLNAKKGDSEKKDLFDELTGAQFVKPAYKTVNAEKLSTEKAMEVISNQIEIAYGKLNSQKEDLNKLREAQMEHSKQINREADKLITARDELLSQIKELQSSLVDESDVKKTKKAIDELKEAVLSLKNKLSEITTDTSLEVAHTSAKKEVESAVKATEAAKNNALAAVSSACEGLDQGTFDGLNLSIVNGVGIDAAIKEVEKTSQDIKAKREKAVETAKDTLEECEKTVVGLSTLDLELTDESSFRKNMEEAQEKVLSIKTSITEAKFIDPSLSQDATMAKSNLDNAETKLKNAQEAVKTLSAALGDVTGEEAELSTLKEETRSIVKPSQTKDALLSSKKAYEEGIAKIKTGIATLEGQAQSILDRIADHKEDTCFACHQTVSGEHSEHAKKALKAQQDKLNELEAKISEQKARIPNGEKMVSDLEAQISALGKYSRIEELEKGVQSRSNVLASIDVKNKEIEALVAVIPDLREKSDAANLALNKEKESVELKVSSLNKELSDSETVKKAIADDLDAVVKANREKSEKSKVLNSARTTIISCKEEISKLLSAKTPYELLVEKLVLERVQAINESIALFGTAYAAEVKAKAAFETENERVKGEKEAINKEISKANENILDLTTSLRDLEEAYAKSEDVKKEIENKNTSVLEFKTKLVMLRDRKNPYDQQIEDKHAQIIEAEAEVNNFKEKVEEHKTDLRMLEYILWLFSPEGLRSYLADPMIEKLNAYVKEYLDEMFFGEVSAVWSPEKSGKNGVINEINVEIRANNGTSKLGLSSGAEEDYPSVAVNLAVGRIAEENMGVRVPFRSFDEILKYIDGEGQHRVMSLMIRICRETGQKFFLVTHDRTLKRFAENEAWIIKKNHISYLSKHPDGLEGERADFHQQKDPHEVTPQEAVQAMIAEGTKKKRPRKPKTEVAS